MDCLEILKTKCGTNKSQVVVEYSVLRLANFDHLRCNTDLKLPSLNWLSSIVGSNGLQHMFSYADGLSR